MKLVELNLSDIKLNEHIQACERERDKRLEDAKRLEQLWAIRREEEDEMKRFLERMEQISEKLDSIDRALMCLINFRK